VRATTSVFRKARDNVPRILDPSFIPRRGP
jgi:hypothetical protein